MPKKKISRVGEINTDTNNSKMMIVEYNTRGKILVKFLDDNIIVPTTYTTFQKGTVKNPYFKSVYNIGYFGVGIHKSSNNNKMNHKYKTWHDMIRRCYDEKRQNTNPSYIDCTVCEEWHNFQNFGEWYDQNYYEVDGERMNLDKDILIKGNRIYSPETCVFVPARINVIFTKNGGEKKDDLPYGVILNNHQSKRYTAKCADDKGKTMYINSFIHMKKRLMRIRNIKNYQ
jgi:hypothetical protein